MITVINNRGLQSIIEILEMSEPVSEKLKLAHNRALLDAVEDGLLTLAQVKDRLFDLRDYPPIRQHEERRG